ncbi:MAG: VRR-NUC domain-containing protein [Edaphocola sp.]
MTIKLQEQSQLSSVSLLTEIQMQAECFKWAWNEHPETRRLLFHVPNGGQRNKIEAGQLKASGVVAGIPDMIFVWKGKVYAFEFKAEKGRVSETQKAVHDAWRHAGVLVWVVWSVDIFKSLFKEIVEGKL